MDPITNQAATRVSLEHINKSFNTIQVLTDISFAAHAGEIHALLGENGAGKSTLMKILAGAYSKDSGRILIDGVEIFPQRPADSQQQGIHVIYQELSLVDDLTVAENIFLPRLAMEGGRLKWKEIKAEAATLIQGLGFDIPVGTEVGKLSIADKQVVEIAKALSEQTKVLVLDEPTTVLAPRETRQLFATLRRLKAEGVTIIYISHRLEEVFELADRITVMKDGVVSGTMNAADTNQEQVIQLMVGRKIESLFPARTTRGRDTEVLRVENLVIRGGTHGISFSLHAGEVLGMAGLVGSGRTEVARAIFGADPITSGRIFYDGREIRRHTPSAAVGRGISLVPEDRKEQGVLLDLSVKDNIVLAALKSVSSRWGFLYSRKETAKTAELIESLRIKTAGQDTEVQYLSGGNQQKVALAKWLATDCRVILIDEPTRGVDVGAKAEIYKLIQTLSENGTAILVISSEMPEVMGLSDRIVVMRERRISGELAKKDFTEENILRLAIK